jgi:hypothetical protein
MLMIKKAAPAIVVLAALALSPSVHAKKVYLNGVDVSSLKNQTFKNATVTIDQNGDIHIEASGYKVEVLNNSQVEKTENRSESRGGPNPALSKHYFLVTQPSQDGRAGYDFKVNVNGVDYKTIKAKDPQVIMEISAWLNKGENEINIKGTKDLSSGRKSSQATDEAKVIVGIGHEDGTKVVIDYVKVTVRADASQTSDVDKHFVLTAE